MRRLLLLAILAAGPLAPSAAAQQPDSTARPAAPFFTYRDAILAGAFAAGTVAMIPLDRELAHNFRNPVNQANPVLHDAAAFFRFMGQPAPQIIGPTLYVVGRLTHQRRLAALGLHGVEAMVLSTGITGVAKLTLGRARPYVSDDTEPENYAFLRGFKGRDFQSFPSGHVTTAFAVASAVTAELSHWADESHWFHGSKLLVGGVMYGGATLIGLSRMYHDEHWASDVVAGAAVGTFSGIKVVRYNYRHPKNRVERWLLSLEVAPMPDGATFVGWTVPLGATGSAQGRTDR